MQSKCTQVPEAAKISTDREFVVPSGSKIETGYVHVDNLRFGLNNRMSMEAVEKAYRKHLQLGASSSWPPPMGYFDDDEKFVIVDGRHEVIGARIAGKEYIFVAWLTTGI